MFTMFDLAGELDSLDWELGLTTRQLAQSHLYPTEKHVFTISEVKAATSDQFLTVLIQSLTGPTNAQFAGALRSFVYRHNLAGPRVSSEYSAPCKGLRTATYTLRNPHYIPNN